MSLRDIFKNAKRGKKYDLHCPVCGSKKIYKLHSFEWLIPQLYHCSECGYEGYILIDLSDKT